MKEYKIKHYETLEGWFYVDANSPEGALNEFRRKVNNGEIDFSDLEMVDSSDEVDPNYIGDFRVCSRCLRAIESREGVQAKRRIPGTDDPVLCDVCGMNTSEYIIEA